MADDTAGPRLLSVVVPTFREGPALHRALSILRSSLEEMDRPYEIIVVCDGADPDTVRPARDFGGVTVVAYAPRRGKGYALREGMDEAHGDVVAFIDADMELHPDGITTLVDMVDAGADAAIGSKRHPRSQVNYPRLRRLQSAAYQQLIRLLFDLDVTDTQTGLKAIRASALRDVAPSLKSDGFAFDLELLVSLNVRGARIEEGPIVLDYAFESTTGLGAIVEVLRDTWRIYRRHPEARRRAVRRTGDRAPSQP